MGKTARKGILSRTGNVPFCTARWVSGCNARNADRRNDHDVPRFVISPVFRFNLSLTSVTREVFFRQRTFDLLAKAYTSLTLSSAQMYLGLPADELLAGVYSYSTAAAPSF